MPNPHAKLLLGALTGILALIGMVRLAEGGFERGLSPLGWSVILLAMVPFVAYAAWRARHGQLRGRGMLALLVLNAIGFITVWLFIFGPVLALACSLAAFAVIWVSDWPTRQPREDARFVRFEELQFDEDEEENDGRLGAGQ